MLSVLGMMCTLNTLSELPETHEHLDDARLLGQQGWSIVPQKVIPWG